MKKILLISVLVLAAAGVLPLGLFAADIFDLSYSLTEGGFRLELTPATIYKGVDLKVNSTIATRYEIIQQVASPLVCNENPNIQIRDNFVFRSIRGSNKYGNLRVPSDDTPVKSNESLYISDATGDPDTFTLIFGIARPEDLDPGHYSGRVSFTLNPIGGTASSVTRVLDVYVSISEEEGIPPKLEIKTSTGSKTIRLNPRKEDAQAQDVLVVKNGKFRRMFSLVQYLTAPLQSPEGLRLDNDAVKFAVRQVNKGVAINQPTALSNRPDTVYSSGPTGDADDSLVITYSAGDLSKQKAGVYRSRIQYLLEEEGGQKPIDALELEVEYERVFDFAISLPEGAFNIQFNNLKAGEPAQRRDIEMQVISNIGRQYQVSQDVYSELKNKEGDMIPGKNFTVRTEDIETKGKLKISSKQEVKKGSTVLLVSDSEGSPDKFRIIYELECPADIKAGDYSTRITFSLVEI
jgi:hypothetical protein